MTAHTLFNIDNAVLATPEQKALFKNFVERYPDTYCSRNNMQGHLTGSMLVFDESGENVLLTHHKKLKKWLQLGGHNDTPGYTMLDTAIKEAEEEGFDDRRIQYTLLGEVALDLDKHSVGDHDHYDMCFAMTVPPTEAISCSFESLDLQWVACKDILVSDNYEPRLKRMILGAWEVFFGRTHDTVMVSKKSPI